MSREPIVILEIDVPRCTRTYGSAPCTASLSADNPAKCFNMPQVLRADGVRTGCQDPANYDAGVHTIRFATSLAGLPRDKGIIPTLQTDPAGGAAEITIAPTDDYKGILGRRETMRLTIADAVDNDTGLDPYQSERLSGAALFSGVGYDPETRGTYWGRLLRRWPYWYHADARIRRGYVGDDWDDHTVERFVIQSVNGPGAGKVVTVELYDELAKVTDDQLLPPVTDGALQSDLGTGMVDVTLVPEGIGSLYDASGRVRINDEIMTYTRVGDVLTLTARGVDGSQVASHSEGDGVQLCVRYEDLRLDDAWYAILDAAGVSSARIDSTGFTAEIDTWSPEVRVNRTLSEPEPVREVAGSLLRSFGFYAWWDRTAGLIRQRLNRPVEPGETVPILDGERDFIAGNFKRTILEKQRYTDVAYFHGLPDMTADPNASASYARASVARFGELSEADAYGEERLLVLRNPWLGRLGGDTVALTTAYRMLTRFASAPVQIERLVDRSTAAGLAMGDPVDVTLYTEQDDDGSTPQRRYQLVRDQRQPGERNAVTLVSYGLADAFGFITEDTAPDYGSATAEERLTGAWISEDPPGPYSFTPQYKIS